MIRSLLLFAALLAPLTSAHAADLSAETAALEEVAALPWNALSAADWSAHADELWAMATKLEASDPKDEASRTLLFDLYVQAGRAAENSNNPVPPYYGKVAGTAMNISWYRAASLGWTHPALMERLENPDLRASVAYYRDKLDAGTIPGHFGTPDGWTAPEKDAAE